MNSYYCAVPKRSASKRVGHEGAFAFARVTGLMTRSKQDIRERVWHELESGRVGRFPGTRGRIPNFVGAERAADRLSELDVWKRA